jgi:4'-phosphopantetheinyl transferase EntD
MSICLLVAAQRFIRLTVKTITTVPSLTESLLQSQFSARVVVRQRTIADHFQDLHPLEQNHVKKAVQKRRNEFSTGRVCAHLALTALGKPTTPLLAGDKREPLWPEGIIGSISHSANCCIAAVSDDPALLSIGLDVEKNEAISASIRDMIALPEEIEALANYKDDPRLWKLIFSAKESVYKCLFPLLHQWIGFKQARLNFDFHQGTFSAQLDPSLSIPERFSSAMHGRFLLSDDYLFTCLEIRNLTT